MPATGGATALDDLPESIVVEEILVRLPPRDLLRCRAVRKCWHGATSTDKFMLDHHRRQPLLPILSQDFDHTLGHQQDARLFVPRDAGAGQQKLCPVLIRHSRYCGFHAALDGLFIVSEGPGYFICNPVTRKCAPLRRPRIQGDFNHHIAGFFRHRPSGEYRVLWVTSPMYCDPADDPDYTTYYYVLAVGSDDPRCVRQARRTASSSPSLEMVLRIGLPGSSIDPPVNHHGSLHWMFGVFGVVVFNTAAETFRLMSSLPAELSSQVLLLEMDDALAFCRISSDIDTVDVWVMQDYEAEIWSFKHRISLAAVDPLLSPSSLDPVMMMFPQMAVLNEGELLIQFSLSPVLRYDTDGEFLGYVKSEEDQRFYLRITRLYLQDSVIPLPLLHETREEDGPPFFVGL